MKTLPPQIPQDQKLDLAQALYAERDFTGRVVVIHEDAMADEWRFLSERIVMAAGGGGCVNGAGGTSVFVQHIDKAESVFGCGQILRLASDEEAAWFHAEWSA